jgi:hypothetical protein
MTAAIALACGAMSGLGVSGVTTKPYAWPSMYITTPTVAALTTVPRNFHCCCLAGVVPSQ